MEDVLELYHEPYDPQRPVVCFDERPCQLLSEKRGPIPRKPGRAERYDYEYKREGTANLFLFFQPLKGWRHLEVTERRTAVDFAHQMRAMVDEHFPEAERVRVVLDNLSTHTPWALYEAFKPDEARRIVRKLDFHYTPKHGSWLNMAEIEFSILERQCLGRRIPDQRSLRSHIAPWEEQRNEEQATAEWRFTISDARTKLECLYSS
jgi:hypothetical protein